MGKIFKTDDQAVSAAYSGESPAHYLGNLGASAQGL